jgi:hypothetical protein
MTDEPDATHPPILGEVAYLTINEWLRFPVIYTDNGWRYILPEDGPIDETMIVRDECMRALKDGCQ